VHGGRRIGEGFWGKRFVHRSADVHALGMYLLLLLLRAGAWFHGDGSSVHCSSGV
jgi:hypothetical protein